MHGLLERLHFHVDDDDSAQRGGDGGQPGVEVAGVGEDDGVRLEHLAMLAQEVAEGAGAGLLLALDEDLDVDRQGTRGLEPAVDGGDVDEDARLVVGRAAAPQAPVLLGRLERLRLPLLLVAGGLDVVMGVEEERRPPGGLQPLAVRVGMRVRHLEELDVVDADAAQEIAGGLARSTHLLFVESLERDAGDAHQLLQLVEIKRLVLLVVAEGRRDRLVVRGGRAACRLGRHGGAP